MLVGKADGTQREIHKMVYYVLYSVNFDGWHYKAPTQSQNKDID